MGGVKRDRDPRPTSEFDSSELVALTRKPADEPADNEVEFKDLMDELDPPTVRIAVGTTPPVDQAAALRSRTTTAYDPLTTSLLAEVTRRTQTVDELEEPAVEPEPEAKIPTASPRLIRR